MTASLSPKLVTAAGLLAAVALGVVAAQDGGDNPRGTPQPPAAKDPAAAELAKLQGRWRVTKLAPALGLLGPADPADRSWAITGDILTAWDKGTPTAQRIRIKLDPAQSPKRIDLALLGDPNTAGPKSLLGIYKLSGDRLTIAVRDGQKVGTARPAAFEPDDDMLVLEAERVVAPGAGDTADKLVGVWSTSARHTAANDTLLVMTLRSQGACRLDAVNRVTGRPQEPLTALAGMNRVWPFHSPSAAGGWKFENGQLVIALEGWTDASPGPHLVGNHYVIERLDPNELVIRKWVVPESTWRPESEKWTRFAGWDKLKK